MTLLLTSYFLLLTLRSSADDIHDVKPPVALPATPWLFLILFLALATAGYLAFLYWQRNKHKFSKPVAVKTPSEIAYERLQDLERRNLFGTGRVKEYFIELSDITRRYIEDRFNIHAPEMTTEEFLNSVKTTPLIELKHKETLQDFLRFSDMVKFAKYGPSIHEAKESFELAKRFVDETKVRV